ncbi:MAG: hypothetical protein ACI9TA_002869, partial [Reinekea sp.]
MHLLPLISPLIGRLRKMKMKTLGTASVLALTLGATSAMADCGEVSI